GDDLADFAGRFVGVGRGSRFAQAQVKEEMARGFRREAELFGDGGFEIAQAGLGHGALVDDDAAVPGNEGGAAPAKVEEHDDAVDFVGGAAAGAGGGPGADVEAHDFEATGFDR